VILLKISGIGKKASW